MLATIRDDTWNVLNVQHIIPNSKRWDYVDIPGGGQKYIKGPAHMVEGGHHLGKSLHPHPQFDTGHTYIFAYKTRKAWNDRKDKDAYADKFWIK